MMSGRRVGKKDSGEEAVNRRVSFRLIPYFIFIKFFILIIEYKIKITLCLKSKKGQTRALPLLSCYLQCYLQNFVLMFVHWMWEREMR